MTIKLEFSLLSSSVREMIDDNEWKKEGVIHLDESEIQEMTKDDEKPFFVEIVALYEDMSSNQRNYTKSAVESCVDAMVGVNMYKGHPKPGSADWEYREPVGRIVAARKEMREIGGKRVLVAIGKAYITDADAKLRSDIKKKMAGNVSILGDARMVKRSNSNIKDVVQLHKPLKSIDFCNPGRSGLEHAGVVEVVSEMTGSEVEVEEKKTEEKMGKLTKNELLSEYKSEIMEIVGSHSTNEIAEIANARRELQSEKEKFKDEKTQYDAQIAEMKKSVTNAETASNDWKQKYEKERDSRIASDLKVFINEHIAEMKSAEGANEKMIDLALKRTTTKVVDGDLEKSKESFKSQMKASLEEVSELAEMFGGEPASEDDTKTRSHKTNPNPKKSSGIEKFLSPDLAKSRKERVGS